MNGMRPLLLLMFLLFFSPSNVPAQPDAISDFSIEEDTLRLFIESRFVYIPSEYELEVSEPPSSMSIKSESVMEKYDCRNLGEVLTDSPKHLVKGNLIIPHIQEKLFLGTEEQYASKRSTITDDYVDSFFMTNVTLLSWNLMKNLEMSTSVYNLFDEEYRTHRSVEHAMDAIEQDGKTLRVKLTYLF